MTQPDQPTERVVFEYKGASVSWSKGYLTTTCRVNAQFIIEMAREIERLRAENNLLDRKFRTALDALAYIENMEPPLHCRSPKELAEIAKKGISEACALKNGTWLDELPPNPGGDGE